MESAAIAPIRLSRAEVALLCGSESPNLIAKVLPEIEFTDKGIASILLRALGCRSDRRVVRIGSGDSLAFIVGCIVSDGYRGDSRKATGEKPEFAEEYLRAIREATTSRATRTSAEEIKSVNLGLKSLGYIYRSGLWKVIAVAYPSSFLRGSILGDGEVRRHPFQVRISGNRDVLDVAERILMYYGIPMGRQLVIPAGAKARVPSGVTTAEQDANRLLKMIGERAAPPLPR